MVANGRPHRGSFQDLGIDLEKSTLPLVIGSCEVGVVTQQQEEVDGFLVRVVDLKAVLDFQGFSWMGEGYPVTKRGAELGLRRRPGVTDQPNVDIPVFRGLVSPG